MDAYERAEAQYAEVRDTLTANRDEAQLAKDWLAAMYWHMRLANHNEEWVNTVFP